MIGMYASLSDEKTDPKVGLERIGVIKLNTKCATRQPIRDNVSTILVSTVGSMILIILLLVLVCYYFLIRTG